MATVQLIYEDPAPPAVKGVRLELSKEEAKGLFEAASSIIWASPRHSRSMHTVGSALKLAGVDAW